MSMWPVHSLEEAQRVDPALVGALLNGTSLDFFEPASPNVSWNPEKEPLTGGRKVVLIPNQPVSRAWHAAFIKVFYAAMNERYDRSEQPPYKVPKQELVVGPVELVIELGETDEDRRAVVEVVNVATETANALVREAAQHCKREHEELAKRLGLDRPRVGF